MGISKHSKQDRKDVKDSDIDELPSVEDLTTTLLCIAD